MRNRREKRCCGSRGPAVGKSEGILFRVSMLSFAALCVLASPCATGGWGATEASPPVGVLDECRQENERLRRELEAQKQQTDEALRKAQTAERKLREAESRKQPVATAKLLEVVPKASLGEVQELLAAGADVNARDKFGWTALMRAAQNENLEVLQAILSAGADVNARDKVGSTALHAAAFTNGNPAVAQALLSAGAEVDARDNYGNTPLKWAKENRNAAAAKVLRAAGARE